MDMAIDEVFAPVSVLEGHLTALESLREQLEVQGVDQGVVLEIDRILGDSKALEGYYATHNRSKQLQMVMEAMSEGMMAIAAAALLAIVAIIAKMIGWLSGSKGDKSSNTFTGSRSQTEAVRGIMRDQDLQSAMRAADMHNQAHMHATSHHQRSFESASDDGVSEAFDNFKRSLTEPEIDFITSGHRYRVIREAVTDFIKGRYYDYVKDVENDITNWVREGLDKAPHVGNGDDAVQEFVQQQRTVYEVIVRGHSKTVESIKEMGSKYLTHVPQGSTNHLQMFQHKPSSLYPHLDRLWNEIHFDRMSEEDRKLLASLEKVQQRYEQSSRRLQNIGDANGRPWPAVDAIVKMGVQAHRAAVQDIGTLVKVAGFINRSAHYAYNATMKSFSYIIRILTIVSKSSGADAERIKKSLEVMQRKRKELNDILQLG